jgi:ParB-like chromosome segregation protein Spo0J
MVNVTRSIPLKKLIAHPDNPNRMSKVNFSKLVSNIKRSGRYEPLIVRPNPDKAGFFQIINGCHRCQALAKLGYKIADCIVWDIDDEQTDILLATLNRLSGKDELGKKLKLLNRLTKRTEVAGLSKLLPQTARQLERLTNLKFPRVLAEITAKCLLNPMVFFANDEQQKIIEEAISAVEGSQNEIVEMAYAKTKALSRAAALAHIAGYFLNHSRT